MTSQENIFRGVVDRITGRGRAIVETEDVSLSDSRQLPGSPSEINLGDIPEGSRESIVGETVEFVYGGGNYGMLVEEKWVDEAYLQRMERRVEVDLDQQFSEVENDDEQSSHKSSSGGRPDTGETFSAEIERISSAGNGIVEKGSPINIGPVIEDAVGKEITAEMDTGHFARCLTESVQVDNYEIKYQSRKAKAHSHWRQRVNSTIFCKECGSLTHPDGDIRTCPSCGHKQSVAAGSGSDGTTNSDGVVGTDIDTLRKKAVEDAVEEVSENSTTTQHETPTYSRSNAVKEYVKARADGSCEGCGEPAPFTSKTGQPYLHAHHVHELSDGGSDTPDTVVALCPNCHYRVHHGEDGDEYNQRLVEIAQEKENTG